MNNRIADRHPTFQRSPGFDRARRNFQKESDFSIGKESLDVAEYTDDLFEAIDPVRVKTRKEAIDKVRSGEVGAHRAELSERLVTDLDATWSDTITADLGIPSYETLLEVLATGG